MSLWFKVRGMMGDDPPYLAVGTEVSAKYKGAFCEAKVRKVVRSVKCKVTFKQGLGTVTVTDDHIRGPLRVGAVCEVKHPEKKEIIEATIGKIQDCSQYTVVFDDGDITTLRRSALCLKSGRHFAESETLDQLPLTHPEHFGNPVIGGRKGRRSRQTQDDSSDDESVPKKGKKKEEKEADIGKVVCVELGDKKKQKDNWFPGLVVAPTAQDTVRIRVKDEYLVRSFKDGRYFTVPKKEATSFTREIGNKVDNNTLKTAVEKALQYLDRDDLPPHWDRDLLFGIAESSANSDGLDSDSSDDEPREEKDHFVAQLYKFMDDRGTPINKGPTIGTRDVDLYKLFKVVDKLGGYNRVTNHNQWKTISHKLGFGQNSSSITNLVKQAYKKFLHSFEDFYRKLGCTMVNHPRGDRSRHRSGRSLIRDRDRATPVNTLKDKQIPTTSGQTPDKVEVESTDKKEVPKPEEEKKDKQEDASKTKEVKKEKTKVKEEKVEIMTREERKNERLKSKEETQTLPVSEKQKKKDEKSKAIEVFKEKTDEKEDKKAKKEDKIKDKELKGKIAEDDSVEVETESKTKSKAKKEEKSKSASERTRSKDDERLKSVDDKKVTEDKNKSMDERGKAEEKKAVEEKSRFSEGKTKMTETKKKLTEARNKKGLEEKSKHVDSKKSSELNAKEPKSKSEMKGKVADDKSKVSDSKVKSLEEKGKVTELKTRGSDDKHKLQDEKLNLAESKNKANEEKKFGEEKVKTPELKIKAFESKIKDPKVETKSKSTDPKCEEKTKVGDEKQKLLVGNVEEMDSNTEKDNCEKRIDNDKQFTRSRSKEDQRLKKEQPSVSEQRSRNRESKTPVRETAEKKPPPRKKEEMVFVLKKRGRKRKDTETKIEEGLGQIANNVNIVIGDKLKVYYGPTQESKVTYEAKVLDIEEDGLDRMYLVHYTGWNTRYDEWIKRSRIADSLSWSPSRAKRLRQQEAQLKTSKQSCSRRGRPSRDSVPPPRPRSATPSSVTSSSSRTKSPAGSNHGKNQGSSRGGRGRALFRRRTRRTSGHTDISLASETDTEDFESEVEVEPEPEVELSRLRSGNEKRNAAVEKEDSSKEGLTKDDDIKEDKVLRQKALIKKEAVDISSSSTQEEEEDIEVQDDYKDESLDQSTELDTSSEVLVFETRRSTRSRRSCASIYERKDSSLKQYVTKSETGTESDDDQPKGRDFDLNEIRSELKGIEKAVKVPQKAVGGSDVKGEDNLDVKNLETEDTFPSKEIKSEPSVLTKSSAKEEEVVEDIYEFKEPEPFEFEVRPKKDFEDRSPKITRRHIGRIFDDQNVEKDEVVQCEGKQLKRAACQLFDSDEMSEDKTDSDNPEIEVKNKFAKRFALSEEKSSKIDLNEILDRPGIEMKVCHNFSSDIQSDSRLIEEINEEEKFDPLNSNSSETIQPKDTMSVVHTKDGSSFGKDTLTDEERQKNEHDSLIFEDLKYNVDKKVEVVDLAEKQAEIVEKSIGGIFEDEMCTIGQPDNELVIESDKDLRFTSVKLFEDEELKTETVVTEVLADKLISTSNQHIFEDSLAHDNSLSELNVGNVITKMAGVHKEIVDREESVTPIKSEQETKEKSNQNIKKTGKKIPDSSKSPRKKIVREPDGKTTPEKKVRRSGGKKTEEAVSVDPVVSSRNRPVSACEEAFDKLCESPSFRLVSKRSPTPAELEPLNIFTENTQEDEEDRLIIPDDMGIGEPLFSYPRSHEELFPTLVEPQKKIDNSSVSGEFQFSNNASGKDMSHPIDFPLNSEQVQGNNVTPKLHFNISVDETEKLTDSLEVAKDADKQLPKKIEAVLGEELKVKEQEDDRITCIESIPQITQQPILEITDVDIFGKRTKREPALLPVRFTGTDSSDTDSSDEGPRLVIAPEEEEFSQLTPSQEELQETVVDDVSTSEIVLEEIKMGPLAEVEEQVQQEVEVEVVDESQDRVKLTDEESVVDELETEPIVVKVDLSSAEKVENSETDHGPVVELKISEEETTVCVIETTEATECEVLGSLLCQETIPGSPAATPQPAAEEAATPAVEMPFASAPGSSPGPRPLPEPAPVPGASGKSHAAPVLDNTPPTTPDSSVSTLSDDRGGMSPTLDNESSKSHRDSFEIDLDSCVEGAKVDHFSEDDSLVNVEVSCSSDTRLRTQKPSCVKESLPKKRRRSRRRSEGEPNKRSRQSSGRSPRSSTHNGCATDSDDMSESSTAGCVLENSLSSRSPRPSKYNFYVELDPELDCSQRIALLQQKLQELRKTYMNIKAELACIDRRRKKLRRREREEKATKQEVTCS